MDLGLGTLEMLTMRFFQGLDNELDMLRSWTRKCRLQWTRRAEGASGTMALLMRWCTIV